MENKIPTSLAFPQSPDLTDSRLSSPMNMSSCTNMPLGTTYVTLFYMPLHPILLNWLDAIHSPRKYACFLQEGPHSPWLYAVLLFCTTKVHILLHHFSLPSAYSSINIYIFVSPQNCELLEGRFWILFTNC